MCEKVTRGFHVVSDSEIKFQLAELWNILIASKSQIQLCPQQIADPKLNRLSQNEKRTRR